MRERERLFGIGDQARFARLAGTRPIARVLGEDHAPAQRRQRVRVERAMAHVAGVAVEHDRGAARGGRGRLGDQAPEVLRRGPRAQALRADADGRHRRPLRQVEQAVLPQEDRRQDH
jgi:hypothetical protein